MGAFPDGRSALMLITARIRYSRPTTGPPGVTWDIPRLGDTMNKAN